MVFLTKMKHLAKKCFEGDLTLPKGVFWLIGINCLLAGVVYGLVLAPATHGIAIGSNNDSYERCTWATGGEEEDEEA